MFPQATCVTGGSREYQCISTIENVLMNQKTYVPTAKYSVRKNVKPESVRSRYYLTGSYFGDVPIRGKNGRLLWPIENTETNTEK